MVTFMPLPEDDLLVILDLIFSRHTVCRPIILLDHSTALWFPSCESQSLDHANGLEIHLHGIRDI